MKTTSLLAAIALLASCGKPDRPAKTAEATPKGPGPELSAVLATTPEGEARSIAAVRSQLKPGDTVTLTGRIMGADNPFVEGRAVFILGDPTVLTACSDKPGDSCETPWDTCCDTPEDKKRATATIQILGKDGRVLKEPVEGVSGIAKLATVKVSGTVAQGSSADLLLVNASAIQAVSAK